MAKRKRAKSKQHPKRWYAMMEKATEKMYSQEEVDRLVERAIKQDREFQAKVLSNLPIVDITTRQGWIQNPKALQGVLENLRPSQQLTEIQPPTEEILDYIVWVDRSIPPTYPDWKQEVLHPELENTGPAEYDLSKGMQQWLHNGQKNGKYVKGQVIYEYLKKEKMLEGCLSLRDGEEIQKKGVAVFHKLFKSKAIFLWKSVVRGRNSFLSVPCLCECGGGVVLGWSGLGGGWDDNFPALRFAR